MMRFKKPLLTTYIFTGILIAGLITLIILTAKALDSDAHRLPYETSSSATTIFGPQTL
ncbi:hypothetical protein [Nonlabens xiamenensis]|uniref:hypothetical protein n=1 Tax=Nonlabens xiamenensis TaxID=2341043 RepID=UPI0013DE273E|nr:hypothetical protein [Nonlabens xiamenensis]